MITAGVAEDKLHRLLRDKFTAHLGIEEFVGRHKEILRSHLSTHENPPFLYTNNLELRMALVPLAKDAGLSGGEQLDVDEGHQFTYQVQGYYPSKFQ